MENKNIKLNNNDSNNNEDIEFKIQQENIQYNIDNFLNIKHKNNTYNNISFKDVFNMFKTLNLTQNKINFWLTYLVTNANVIKNNKVIFTNTNELELDVNKCLTILENIEDFEYKQDLVEFFMDVIDIESTLVEIKYKLLQVDEMDRYNFIKNNKSFVDLKNRGFNEQHILMMLNN